MSWGLLRRLAGWWADWGLGTPQSRCRMRYRQARPLPCGPTVLWLHLLLLLRNTGKFSELLRGGRDGGESIDSRLSCASFIDLQHYDVSNMTAFMTGVSRSVSVSIGVSACAGCASSITSSASARTAGGGGGGTCRCASGPPAAEANPGGAAAVRGGGGANATGENCDAPGLKLKLGAFARKTGFATGARTISSLSSHESAMIP